MLGFVSVFGSILALSGSPQAGHEPLIQSTAPKNDPDVITLRGLPITDFEPGRKTVKIRVHFVRAADISDALGGGVLDLAPGRVDNTGFARYTNSAAGNLLPEGIDSLVANIADNTLITRYSDRDALAELLELVKGLDVRPSEVSVQAVAWFIYTDRYGKQTVSSLSGRGAALGERRIHLQTRRTDAAPLLAQSSDLDIFARAADDGTIHLAADWHVGATVPSSGTARATAAEFYRVDVIARAGKPADAAAATLSLGGGKLELKLSLTAKMMKAGEYRPGWQYPGR